MAQRRGGGTGAQALDFLIPQAFPTLRLLFCSILSCHPSLGTKRSLLRLGLLRAALSGPVGAVSQKLNEGPISPCSPTIPSLPSTLPEGCCPLPIPLFLALNKHGLLPGPGLHGFCRVSYISRPFYRQGVARPGYLLPCELPSLF